MTGKAPTWAIEDGYPADFGLGRTEGTVTVRITAGPHAEHTATVHTKAYKERYDVTVTCSCGATVKASKDVGVAPTDESTLQDVALFFVDTAGAGLP